MNDDLLRYAYEEVAITPIQPGDLIADAFGQRFTDVVDFAELFGIRIVSEGHSENIVIADDITGRWVTTTYSFSERADRERAFAEFIATYP